MRKIRIALLTALVALTVAGCAEEKTKPPPAPTPTHTTIATLSSSDKEAVDKLGGDIEGLGKILGSTSNDTQRAYAEEKFLSALAKATLDDLKTVETLADILPQSRAKMEARVRANALKK